MLKSGFNKNSKQSAYVMLWFVVFVWAITPTINKLIYDFSSPTVVNTLASFLAFVALLIYCRKDLKFLNKKYFLVAVPTGVANAVGSLVQKIGLLYTTPSQYAFLENLSCITVPILMFLFIKKAPSFLTILSAILCLVGAFILCGLSFDSAMNFGIGEILCALAGIIYGFNIAGTGCFAKQLKASLYILIHMGVSTIVCLISTFVLNAVKVDGAPITPIYFSFKSVPAILLLALVSNVLCWIFRTNSMKKINPSTVAVIMPFSAVITSVVSIILGTDKFSLSLLIGGMIIFVSILFSSFGDNKENKEES